METAERHVYEGDQLAYSGPAASPSIQSLTNVRLVRQSRKRAASPLAGRDRTATLVFAASFLATAVALATTVGVQPVPSASRLLLLVGCHAALSRISFELGSGMFLPTQLALVPMLFLAPPSLVPLLVACGYVAGLLPDLVAGNLQPNRAFVRISYSWHAVGPAAVFVLLQPGAPTWNDWPTYLLALAAQFALDGASAFGREWLAVGVAPRAVLPVLAHAYVVDLLLAPVGFVVALAAVQNTFAVLTVLPLGGLLALSAYDRRARLSEAIELAQAVESESSAARVDRLTGLANRLAWEEAIESLELEAASRHDPISIVLFDLDGLKHANDTRGHAFGDALIQNAAEILAECVGDEALVARFGGDELCALLPGTDESACSAVVSKLEEKITSHPGIDGVTLSVSVGYGTSPLAPTIADAIDIADSRMYERKRVSQLSRAYRHEPTLEPQLT
jgi:diguanylate cyclase (GGDEF)-like protein